MNLALLERILTRWYEAGHPERSLLTLSELEAGDTGVVVDADSNTLIATQDEWQQYERLYPRIETLHHDVSGSPATPGRLPANRTRTPRTR